ncbi:MAG: SpoIIE family protein phosphatase [Firmicutes bacterium]|nr:SpoIIE family protein phosphatase [Bacillota bacterium]
MAPPEIDFLRDQLIDRRRRLQTALQATPDNSSLTELLAEVDGALARMQQGRYGLCEICQEPIERDRLLSDPLLRYCLDHLSPSERQALERDLELAAQIQSQLLPPRESPLEGWEVAYNYQPMGLVSGDYCDLMADPQQPDRMFFVLGDVAGKGVASSMLMTHLHAIFRSLVRVHLPLEDMVAMANRIFCESALAGQYATLVCGRATRTGEIELHNAGHWPALVVRRGSVERIDSTNVPLGMFPAGQFVARRIQLHAGESLFLYTDGLVETRNPAGTEFGLPRLMEMLGTLAGAPAEDVLAGCLRTLAEFRQDARRPDDLTLLVLRRAE